MAKGGPETSVVMIPLNTGTNESVAERLAPVGLLSTTNNCRIRDGQLVKRGGSTQSAANDASAMVAGDSPSSYNCAYPSFVSTVGRQSVLGNTEGVMCAYSPSQDFFYFQGLFSTCKPVRQRYGILNTTPTTGGTANSLGECPPSTAVDANGNICTTVCDNDGTQLYAWIETAQGARIWYTGGTISASRSQVIALSTGFYLIYQTGTDLRMSSLVVATTGSLGTAAVTWGSSSSIGTLDSSTCFWDTTANAKTGDAYVVYQRGATEFRVKAIVGASTGNLTDITGIASGSKSPVSIYAEQTYTNNVWVGWYEDPAGVGQLRYAVYNRTITATVLANTLIYAAGSAEYGPPMFGLRRRLGAGQSLPDGTQVLMVVRRVTSTGYHAVCTKVLDTSGTSGTPNNYYGAIPLGKPDDYMRVWCMVSSASTNQLENRVALLGFRESTGSFTDIQLAGPNFVAFPQAVSPASNSTHKWQWLCGPARYYSSTTSPWVFSFPEVLTQVESTGTDATLMKVSVYEYQTGQEDYHQVALPIGTTTVVGGQPTEFWGQPAGQVDTAASLGSMAREAAECGFLHSPTILSITTSAATGPGAGTYSYKAVYEWTDAYGRRHRSAPSAPYSVTLATGNELPQLIVTAMQMSQRVFTASSLFPVVVIYRTLNGGTEYHRTSVQAAAATTVVPNVSMTDANTDADIDSNEFLYTDGGVLDFSLAPSCRFMAASEDRVWAGGLWDPTIIQCSRVIIPGEPLQWAEHGSHQVVLGDDCTGLAYMDGTVIAFTRNDIRLITGDGPNEQGIGGFPPPRIYMSGIGCSNYRSIVQTPAGILFQYGNAIHLIPRGFGPVVNISANVRRHLEYYPTILSSAYLDGGWTVPQQFPTGPGRQNLARFILASSLNGGSQEILTLDLTNMQWFVDIKFGYFEMGVWNIPQSTITTDASSPDRKTFALAMALDRTTRPRPVEYESASASEGSTLSTGFIGQTIRTGWISPFGLVGWGRVRKVVVYFERDASGSGTSTAFLDMEVKTLGDGGETTQSNQFQITQTEYLPGVEFREMQIDKAVCSSIQIRVIDSYSVGDTWGRGVRFMAFALEVEPLSGLRPQVSTEKA